MVHLTYCATALTFVAVVLARPSPLSPDPAGAKNVGNGHGAQFIGGACLSAADCASGCCATLNGAGICSGPDASFQAGKQGCGFGGSGSAAAADPPTTTAAAAAGSSTAGIINPSLPGAQNVGKGDGSQFITGQCFSNADCASGCCAGLNGAAVCSGPDASFQNGKTGCGFTLTGGSSGSSGGSSVTVQPVAAEATASADAGQIDESEPGAQNVGKGDGSQFITGQCFSNADCASGCCAGLNGAGVCSGPDADFQNGKTGCGFSIAGSTVAAAAAAPAATTPAASGATVINESEPGAENVGKGNGSQFITGQCFTNADCASGCCAGLNGAGVCSGPDADFQNGKTGCGFVAR